MDSVLVVDSDTAFLRIAKEVLQRAGMDADTAGTGKEALERLRVGCAVLVVSFDLRDVPPEDVIQGAVVSLPDIECIALTTARDDPQVALLHEEQLLFNHLTKPLDDIRDLARQVGRALERRALRRQKGHLLTELRDARDALRTQAEFFVQAERLAIAGRLAADILPALAATLESEAHSLRLSLDSASAPDSATQAQAAMLALERAGGAIASTVDLLGLEQPRTDGVLLADAVEAVVQLFRPWADAHGVELCYEAEQPVPLLEAPALEVAQALAHLLMNACQATPQSGTVAVRLFTEADGRLVVVTVSDTGPGIPPDHARHLFQPFFTTRPFGCGTGLGLYAARELLRRHDGDVRLASSSPAGTTVCLVIPAKHAACTVGGRVSARA